MNLPLISSTPHVPKKLTWRVTSPHTGLTAWSTTNIAPLGTWWPSLTPDICAMVNRWKWGQVGDVSKEWCGDKIRYYLSKIPFYVCPRDRLGHRPLDCGENVKRDYYCHVWGCETSGSASWIDKPPTWDLIRVQKNKTFFGPPDWKNALNITFTQVGKGMSWARWKTGFTWGLRLYQEGYDDGFLFKINLEIDTYNPPVPIGPNPVLSDLRPPLVPLNPQLPTATPTADPHTSSAHSNSSMGQRLLGLVQGAFSFLNVSDSTLTESCWLCLTMGPPYYEGVAFLGNYTNTTSPTSCTWGRQGKLTLTEVSGQGTCIGDVPTDRQRLCSETMESPFNGNYYLVPPRGGWWACNTGLTPCLAAQAFNKTSKYCVLVQLVPRIIYYPATTFESEFDPYPSAPRRRRELVSLTLVTLLGLGVAAGVGTGAAALIKGPSYTEELRIAIDEDLRNIEQSITKLEESLTSLSEVVLQNRRGLDLLFLKEGGLCAALKEQCCFYADHSGVIKDSMSKLRERLETRKKERESRQGWFEGWFNASPWLTTLISTLLGPLIILLLFLTFGPCILNRLMTFVRDKISAVQLMVLQQRYQPLPADEDL